MNVAIAFYLAAAAAQSASAQPDQRELAGAQVAEARVAVQILRTAVLRDGTLAFSDGKEGPRTQQVQRDERVTYEFE